MMHKKKYIILIPLWILLLIISRYFWDNLYCTNIQRRCTMYDLSEFDNEEDIDFYRWLNEKCASWGRECWTKRIKLSIEKRRCRYQYKKHVERSKDRKTFAPDTYNPCPEFYTIKELNNRLTE